MRVFCMLVGFCMIAGARFYTGMDRYDFWGTLIWVICGTVLMAIPVVLDFIEDRSFFEL